MSNAKQLSLLDVGPSREDRAAVVRGIADKVDADYSTGLLGDDGGDELSELDGPSDA